MKWADANREIFDEYLAAGDTFGCEVTIADAKAYGLDTSQMEQELRTFKNEDKEQ